ncbi:MAG: amidohydrolase family protein [Bacteroidota bacterium]
MGEEKLEIIDVHTHLFNLNHLPVRGILQSYGIPYPVAVLAAILLRQFTNKPRKRNFDSSLFNELESSFPLELLNAKENTVIDHISVNTRQDTFFDPMFQFHLLEAIEKGHIELEPDLKSFAFGNQGLAEDWDSKIYSIVKKILDLIKDGFEYIKWFFFMMRSEEEILKMLISSYGDDVGHFVFHMMDPQYFFAGKPRLSMKSKIRRMKKFINRSNGRLIGFVAFNPKRRTKKGMELIKYALNNGFSGVKFYPPMGYRASQNDEDIDGYYKIPNGQKIEQRVLNFFRFCVNEERDVPVFTHCTPSGFQAKPYKKSGVSSDPRFWENLLKMPGMKNLRLCLGHAGGEKGWASGSEEVFENSYAYKVYQLCINYPNVYCEVGFLAHIKNDDEKKNFINRLVDLFTRNEGEFHFADKIMYGSDWHILFNDGLQVDYHKEFLEIFQNETLSKFKQKFFSLNAKRYLKL